MFMRNRSAKQLNARFNQVVYFSSQKTGGKGELPQNEQNVNLSLKYLFAQAANNNSSTAKDVKSPKAFDRSKRLYESKSASRKYLFSNTNDKIGKTVQNEHQDSDNNSLSSVHMELGQLKNLLNTISFLFETSKQNQDKAKSKPKKEKDEKMTINEIKQENVITSIRYLFGNKVVVAMVVN